MSNKPTLKANMDDAVFEDHLFEFLELSNKIKTLIGHENAILAACGCLTLEAYLGQRNALLQSYEKQASSLCDAVTKGSAGDEVAQNLLIEEIASVKDTLSDNALKQFQSLESGFLNTAGSKPWH